MEGLGCGVDAGEGMGSGEQKHRLVCCANKRERRFMEESSHLFGDHLPAQ